jgi:polar amino acid transport system permease protein
MQNFFTNAVEFLPILAVGIKNTLIVTAGSLLLSTALGLFWAILRLSSNGVIRGVGATIVNFLRSIPIIVQLFYIYFVLPEIGIELTAVQAAILGLGIAYSAYQAEDFRAGIQALDRGQIEAAQSLNMSYGLMMRRVILPQAIKIILPSYGNTMVMMLKDNSLASTITVGELSLQGKLLAASTFQNTTVFTLVAFLYLLMCGPLMLLNRWMERRMSTGHQ